MVVWHASFFIAYKDNSNKAVEVVKDRFGVRRVAGSSADWAMAKKLPKFVEFSTSLGVSDTPVLPENVASYVFRFNATTTNGSVHVVGSNDRLSPDLVTNDLSAVASELQADQSFDNYFLGNPNVSLLFINSDYIDYSEGSSSSEGWTLRQGLESFGVDYQTFTAIDAEALSNILAQGNKFLLPENEEDTVPWSNEAKAVIADWVAAGNNLFVFYMFNWVDTFNSIFGFNLEEGEGSGPYNKSAAAADTVFSGGAASIQSLSATDTVKIASLPDGSIAVYDNGTDSALSIIPFGEGKIYVFGWDWYDAIPVGSEGGDWVNLLQSAVQG